ncbi:MAG: Hpt domain-containing protein [Bacteroidia bacterium]|nr:Hpt domain-containing protein [Bacteroidia bacterium]
MKNDNLFINMNYLEEALLNAKEALLEVINSFIENIPNEMLQLTLFIQEPDFELIKQKAHKIKASFSIVGMKAAADLCYQLEISAKNNSLAEVKSIFLKLEDQYESGYKELKQYKEKIMCRI